MKIVPGTLCLMLLAFPNPTELARPHKEGAVHPMPIELILNDFNGTFLQAPGSTIAGIWYAGTNREINQVYIIGLIIAGYLCPIMAPRADLNYDYGKVKVRIDGNVANVTAPIFNEDPLNNLFYKQFHPHKILAVKIPE